MAGGETYIDFITLSKTTDNICNVAGGINRKKKANKGKKRKK